MTAIGNHERPGLLERLFSFLGHVGAIAFGAILMLVAIGMGVTMTLLPIAIPVGVIGLLMFAWGFFGFADSRK